MLIAVFYIIASSFYAMAQTQTPIQQLTVLTRDSGTNLSQMNATFSVPFALDAAQAVKFTAPRMSWKLERVLIYGTDGWNSTQGTLPSGRLFALEVRDKDLNLLYHFTDEQIAYFTSAQGSKWAQIEIPSLRVSDDFYICLYGYGNIGVLTELQNATGNSYYFVKNMGLRPGELILRDNRTLPVNWIIRAAGE